MIGDRFKEIIAKAYSPFLKDLGFAAQEPHVSGRYHSAKFIGMGYTLIVSIEAAEHEVTVMLVDNNDDDLASIDDPLKTPRLSDLNRRYMAVVSSAEREDNEKFFSEMSSNDQDEKALLKCAKELRLVLPKHLS